MRVRWPATRLAPSHDMSPKASYPPAPRRSLSLSGTWRGKGRILRACRAFKQGELLFEEPPLHIVVADKNHEAFLQVQKVCEKHQAWPRG